MTIKRLAPSAVLAIGITTLIGLGMAAMIKSEFTQQEKAEKVTFEINPVPDDILPPPDRIVPEQVKRVETPPPPPVLDKGKSEKHICSHFKNKKSLAHDQSKQGSHLLISSLL